MELRKRSFSDQYIFKDQEHSFTVLQRNRISDKRDETIFSLNRAGKPFILYRKNKFLSACWARSPILVFIDINQISGIKGILFRPTYALHSTYLKANPKILTIIVIFHVRTRF